MLHLGQIVLQVPDVVSVVQWVNGRIDDISPWLKVCMNLLRRTVPGKQQIHR